MIRIIRVTDPLDPSRNKQVDDVAATGASLALVLHQPKQADVTVSVNGQVWPQSSWEQITPRDGDTIVIAPVVAGGGILKTLASVALLAGTIALAATGVGGAAVAGLFGIVGTGAMSAAAIGTAILTSAVGLAGNLLISAFLSPSPSAQKSDTASYDADGPRSLARSGTVIPKGYGRFRWGGNIISSFTDLAGSDQFINVLVCYGFGPARAIADIELNGKPITDYQNVQVYTRLGNNSQTEIAGFNRIVNQYPQQTECLAGQPVVVPGTGTLTQALQVDIAFPDGLFVNTSLGHIIPLAITYQVEYCVSGTYNWQPAIQPRTTVPVVQMNADGSAYLPHAWGVIATDLPPNSGIVYTTDDGPHTPGDKWTGTQTVRTFQPNGNSSTYSKTFQGEWQLLQLGLSYVQVTDWSDGYVEFDAAQTNACYNRTSIYGLAPNKYDVRVTKYGTNRLGDDIGFGDNLAPNIGQDMWMHSVNEVAFLDLVYPNMILIGVRALATSQLSGANLSVTALIDHGLRSLDNGRLPVELQSFGESNPACVAADMFVDNLYGGGAWPGIQPANLERYIDEWVSWAQLNATLVPDGNGGSLPLHAFNGVFDNEGDLWTQAQAVAQMSRACIVPQGLDYGVAVDQAVDAPVQMFNVGNIHQDSFSEMWLPVDERTNQVEVQFADATRFYKQDNPLVYQDPADQNSGTIPKVTRISAKGCTLPAQAFHLARYKQRAGTLLLRSGSFKTDTAGIACRPFNVVALQHDVPQWGFGGRLLPGNTTSTLLLDRTDIPFVAGTSYSVTVLHPVVHRFDGVVGAVATSTSPPGVTLTVAGWTNAARLTRALVAGEDCAVMQSSAGSVIVSPPPGFVPAIGQAVSLYDSDVLETAGVVAVSTGSSPSLQLSTPLSQAPVDYAPYIYGVTGSTKLVRVVGIRKASEQRSTLDWIDYDPAVYTTITPTVGSTSVQTTTRPGITSLTGDESFQKVAGTYASFADLAWKPGPDTAGVAIFAQFAGSAQSPSQVAKLDNATSWSAQQSPGTTVIYTVVGYDSAGSFAAFTAAPSVTVEAVGIADNLLLGSNFASGFSYWSLAPRAGDTLAATYANDGAAVYTVNGTALTAVTTFLAQTILPSQWQAGQSLMLSAYLSALPTGAPATRQPPPAAVAGGTVASSFDNAYVSGANFYCSGWAMDQSAGSNHGVNLASVTLVLDGYVVGTATLGDSRSDVSSYYGGGSTTSGWHFNLPLASVTTAAHTLQAVYQDAAGHIVYSATKTMAAATGTLGGNLVAQLVFTGSTTTTFRAALTIDGTPGLTRVHSAATAIPAGTTSIAVQVLVDGSSLSLPAGTVLTCSHLLLEEAVTGQTAPSEWADIDVSGQILDLFTTGSSAGLRSQASSLPLTNGGITYDYTSSSITVHWTGLQIMWPDGGVTHIQDGSSAAITGLDAGATYALYLYYDVALGQVTFSAEGADSGTPALLFAAPNGTADAACYLDGRVALTPTGTPVSTGAAPTGGGGTGGTGTGTGGGGTGGFPTHPVAVASPD